jgi:hypothetical protein
MGSSIGSFPERDLPRDPALGASVLTLSLDACEVVTLVG